MTATALRASPSRNPASSQYSITRQFLIALLVGVVYLVLSLPKATAALGAHLDLPILVSLGRHSESLSTMLPEFYSILGALGIALLACTGLLVLLALRYGDLGIFSRGSIAFVLSAAVLHIIAWAGFAVVYLFIFAYNLVRTVGSLIEEYVWVPVKDLAVYLLGVLSTPFEPLLGTYSWIGFAVSLLGLLAILLAISNFVPKGLQIAIGVFVGITVGLVGIGILLGLIVGLFVLLAWLLGPVLPAVGAVLVVVLGITAGIFAVMLVGQLFIDQVRGSKYAGSGRRGAIMGGVSVGSVCAILLVETNHLGAYDWYPTYVSTLAAEHIYQTNPPSFDATVAVIITALCGLGLLRGIMSRLPEPSWDKFRKSMIYAILGVFVAGVIAGIGARTE